MAQSRTWYFRGPYSDFCTARYGFLLNPSVKLLGSTAWRGGDLTNRLISISQSTHGWVHIERMNSRVRQTLLAMTETSKDTGKRWFDLGDQAKTGQ